MRSSPPLLEPIGWNVRLTRQAGILVKRAKYADLEVFVTRLEPEKSIPALLVRDFDLISSRPMSCSTADSSSEDRPAIHLGLLPRMECFAG